MRKLLGAAAVMVAATAPSIITVGAVAVPPAAACDGNFCGSGNITDAGLLAETAAQMDELSTGRGGRSIPCTDEDPLAEEDGNEDVEAHGVYRWVPDYANDPTPPDDGAGEWYRYVCYIEGRPVFPASPAGASWRRFEAVTPENVALLAIDRMLAGIPTQWVHTSPDAAGANGAFPLVGMDTWFWIDASSLDTVTAQAGVPGIISVVATARPSGVTYDFGDGASLECDEGVPWSPGATSECTHAYQAAGGYTVTSSIGWSGTYSVNGGPATPIGSSIVRQSTLAITVEEAQAINTNG